MTERGKRMNLRLVAAIEAVVPPEVGRWDDAWGLTAAADRKWNAALVAWDRNENRATTAALREAFDEFVDAWKKVVVLWKRNREAA